MRTNSFSGPSSRANVLSAGNRGQGAGSREPRAEKLILLVVCLETYRVSQVEAQFFRSSHMFHLLLFVGAFSCFTLVCWFLLRLLRRPIFTRTSSEFSRTAQRFSRTYQVLAALTCAIVLFWTLIGSVSGLLTQSLF
jgi:hypothetical protein